MTELPELKEILGGKKTKKDLDSLVEVVLRTLEVAGRAEVERRTKGLVEDGVT